MRRAPQPIHDRHAQTFLGQRLGHDAIQSARDRARAAGERDSPPLRADCRLCSGGGIRRTFLKMARRSKATRRNVFLLALRSSKSRPQSRAAFADDNATATVPALPSGPMRAHADLGKCRQFFSRDRPGAQHLDAAIARRNHGRFDAVFSRAAIHDERDAPGQFLHHVTRRGRADPSEAIGAWRGERLAKGAHHLREKRIRTHSNRDRFQTRGHDRRHDFPAREDDREGAGPEIWRSNSRSAAVPFSSITATLSSQASSGKMHDQRIEMRAFFCFENFHHRFGGKSVRRQAVDRLGRQRDDFTCPQQIHRARHRLPRSLGEAVAPISVFTSPRGVPARACALAAAASTVSPSAVRCPILRPGRGSRLP